MDKELLESLKRQVEYAFESGGEGQFSMAQLSLLEDILENVESSNAQLEMAESLLRDAHDLLDDIHGYDTDVYREISAFLNGEEEY